MDELAQGSAYDALDRGYGGRNAGLQMATKSARPPRPMERVAGAADRAERILADLISLNERFVGVPDTVGNGAGQNAPIPFSYTSNLDRLHANLDRIESLVGMISEVA